MSLIDNVVGYKHSLSEFKALLLGEGLVCRADEGGTDIEHLSYDNREVRANTLFFCKGERFKAEYLLDAAKRGAVAYVSEVAYDYFFDWR